jgi:hypothetical protein
MRLIATPYHGIIDYAAGAMLIAAPWVLGFAHDTTAGAWISVLAGSALMLWSTFADYEGAVFARIVPMREHLGGDLLLGLLLLVTPFAFGFADRGTYAWVSFVLAGAGFVVLAAITQTTPLQGSDRAVSRAWAQEMRAHNRRLRQAGGRMARNH